MRNAFDRKLRNVHLRCSANVLLEQMGFVLILGGLLAALAAAVERALAVRHLEGWHLLGFLGVLALVVAALWILKRPRRMQVAILLDERLATRERFSTALMVADSDAPFARAACDEAHRAAKGVNVQGKFPVRPSRRWVWAGAVWLVLGGIVAFMPDLDVLGYAARRDEEQKKAREVASAKKDVQQALMVVRATVKPLASKALAVDLTKLGDLKGAPRGADLRREAIRKLGEMAEQIKKMRKEQRLDAARKLQAMLKRLRGKAKSLSNELNQALAKGKFSKASELARELQKKLESGKLSDADKKDLAEHLADLSRQLEKLARDQKAVDQKALEEALEKAGVDKKLASLDEQALREALKDAGLTDEQIEELMEQASDCRQACAKCGQLAELLARCEGGLLEGELVLGELAELADLLDEWDSLSKRLVLVDASLENIDAAIALLGKGKCKGGKAGLWARKKGSGPGPGGPAWGLRKTGPETPTGFEKTGVKNKPTKGPVIASWYFKGPQVKGESKREFAEVVQAAKDRAAEAIRENRIPREHQGVVKKYFGEVEKSGE